MAEAAQHGNIGVVMDGPTGQRLVERLIRCGLAARAVSSTALAREAVAGQFYLGPIGMASDVDTLAHRGVHLCLIPPWPNEMTPIGQSTVGVEAVERRGAVRFAAHFADAAPDQVDPLTSLRILYRERLIGTLGEVFAESEHGEPLLATLPRTSNLHGYIVVSSLQLGIASAQTRFEDVARLLDRLLIWCTAQAEPVALLYQQNEGAADYVDPGMQFAPIVMLALALVLPQQAALSAHHEAIRGNDVAYRESVRIVFDRVCRILGLPVESRAFDIGWAWLEAHAVVFSLEGDKTRVSRDALEHYIATWQLGPRLRRLRRIAGDQ